MNDIPRQTLQHLIVTYGLSLCDNPTLCKSLLLDFCGKYRREINILLYVLEEQIVADLLKQSKSTSYDINLARYIKLLYDYRGLPEEFARWGIESWAMALGVIPSDTDGPNGPSNIHPENRLNDEKYPPEWIVFGKSVRGASPIKASLPNQDAILWTQGLDSGIPLVLTVADGLGSKKYFRSDVGAFLAVQAANAVMNQFAKDFAHQTLSQIENDMRRLPSEIVSKWKELVQHHWEETPLTEIEWQRLHDKENEVAVVTPFIPYGTTVTIALVTKVFILYLQLGDGDILTVSTAGEVSEPITADKRSSSIQTASLCDPEPEKDFRLHFQPLEKTQPALIILATDGYANSFRERKGFYKVGSDIWQLIRSKGEDSLKTIGDNLENWLTQASKTGSGDDITVGLLCRASAFKNQANSPVTLSPLESIISHEQPPAKPIPTEGKGTTAPSIQSKHTVVFQDAPVTHRISPGDGEAKLTIQLLSGQGLQAKESSKVASTQKQEFMVSQDENGDYTTISDAIQNAPPNTRILVQPGHYLESLDISKPLHIKGSGPGVIIESRTGACVRLHTKRAVITNLILRGHSLNQPTIEIQLGRYIIQKCDITSASSNCVILSSGARPTLRSCVIHDGKKSGIAVYNDAQALIENCHIYGNANGIELKKGSVTIQGGQIRNNEECGIIVQNGGKLTISMIKSSISSENVMAGEKLKVHGNKRNGILIQQNSEGTIEDCDIYENSLAGIKIQEGERPIIVRRCAIHDGQGCGILIYREGKDQAHITMKSSEVHVCKIYGNAHVGVEIRDYANPLIENCSIHDGKRSGILVCIHGKGTISNCHIFGNAYFGVAIKENGHPSVEGCYIKHNLYEAISVDGKSGGTIKNCVLTFNKRGMWYLEAGCQLHSIGNTSTLNYLFSQLFKKRKI